MLLAPDPTQPRIEFESHFPRQVLRRLLDAVRKAYSISHADAFSGRYDDAIARRRWGFDRKYEVDQQLVNLGRALSLEGYDIIGKPAEADYQGEGYALLESGMVKVVQAKVDAPGVCPRRAKYRDGYARDALLPFAAAMAEDNWGVRPVFAVLVHGPAGNEPVLAHAWIGFPDRHGKKFLDHIDLLAMFPDEGEEPGDEYKPDAMDGAGYMAAEEQVPSELSLPLRTQPKIGDQ